MAVCVVVVVVVLQLLLQLHKVMAAHELSELCGIHVAQGVLQQRRESKDIYSCSFKILKD